MQEVIYFFGLDARLNVQSSLPYLCWALFMLAGLSDAVRDYLPMNPEIKSNYWHHSRSQKNKWKNGDFRQGEKFFLSSRLLVWTTTGWHLMKTLYIVFIILGTIFYVPVLGVFDLILIFTAIQGPFEITYSALVNKIVRKNKN